MTTKLSFLAIFIVAAIAACTSKKTISSGTVEITDQQVAAVVSRFPDATKSELEKGRSVYEGPCTKCHGKKDITVYREKKLLDIVDAMSKKASLSPEDKQALIRFAVAVRSNKK